MTFLSSNSIQCTKCKGSGIIAGTNEYEIDKCEECNGIGRTELVNRTYRLDFTIQELDILNRYMLGESFSNTDWNKFYMLKIRITNYMNQISGVKE